MWFAKLFGGRDDESVDEEPTATPPQRPAIKATVARVKRPRQQQLSIRKSEPEAKRKGFDPYNSGSFERRNAWERIGRR